MRKLFTLLVGLVAAYGVSFATTFTFDSEGSVSQTIDGYSVAIEKGAGNNAPAYYPANGLRLYASNTITVSGANISKISIAFSKQGQKEYATLSASTGSLASGGTSTSDTDVKVDTWTGNATSVTFTLGTAGQRLIKELVINGDANGGETPSNPGGSSSDDELDPNYKYAEPTIVAVPSTTVQGAAYSFVSNNIKVSATKGAITADYFSAHADYAMTFTATKIIKGIVINGFVKKAFEASVDNGKISYLSPSEDTEANPVVVITDVNSTSVTINCVKQLRCYNVEVYFEENPETTLGGGGSGSQEDLEFDSGEAVYESAYVEMIGEENYSIFLYNAASYDYPYMALDIYPTSEDLTGTYTWDDYTLGDYTYYLWGEGDYDMAWAEDGNVVITKKGDIYTIEGFILGDNGVTYNFTFTGELPIYLDEDYYGDGDGVSDVTVDGAKLDENAPMYNVLGHKVNSNYKGIVIQNGRKFINR